MTGVMGDTLPLVRQWTLLRSLSASRNGRTVQELADDMAVSQKTIRRDLGLLARVGFPLVESIADHGRKSWRIAGDGQPPMHLAFDELAALYLGRRFLEPLAGTLIWDAAQRAFRKIRAGLGEDALRYLEKLADVFHATAVGASDYSARSEAIDNLMVAIEDRRIAFITYRSMRSTEPVTYDVYPYGLIYHRGSLYLVAFAPQHEEIRHYRVDRIDAVEVQNLQFVKPADFDLKRHLERSFGVFSRNGEPLRIKIRFSPEVARYVKEKRWHPSQKLTRRKDGAVVAEFRLSATEEIKSWILSFGAKAEVLEPKSLRIDVLIEALRLLLRYEKTPKEDAKQ
jgi:predicted DNA-binding transcriptional regulator YafY